MPPAVIPAAPPAARTAFTFVAGAVAAGTPPTFTVTDTSPLVTSLVFLPWEVGVAGTPARVVRSAVVGAIIMATRRPADPDLTALSRRSILASEMLASEVSTLAHHLDIAGAFAGAYETIEQWEAAIPGILASMAPASLPLLRLTAAMFYDGLVVTRNTPVDILFLSKVSVGDLVRVDSPAPDASYHASALSRAIILLGWKDEPAVVQDGDSEFRQSVERLKRVLARRMPDPDGNASDSAYGRELCSILGDPRLPLAFARAGTTPLHASEELSLTFDYWRGTTAQVQSIQLSRFLGVPRQFPDVGSLVRRFSDPAQAFTQTEMVAATLLPAALSSASLLARLSQLDTRLASASWRASIAHVVNVNPAISGEELAAAIIASHNDLAGGTAGAAAPLPAPGDPASYFAGASYGSVRDASIADALRTDAAVTALAQAANQTGVERVETLLLSGSTLLMRAIFLQEAWLQNKASALSFCSLDQPYLCPYIAESLTERADSDGSTSIPDALQGFVYPGGHLDILRSGKWSTLDFINSPGGQLQIEHMETGAVFSPVSERDRFTVDAVLDYMELYGKRLFFAIGFSLSPQTGHSFSDLLELQRKALRFARTLPQHESAEWLTFLHAELAGALDLAGGLYLSKLKSARPERDEAAISAFLPDATPYWINVNARLTRAQPLAQLRSAFPTLFSSEPVSVPGTATDTPPGTHQPGKNRGKGAGKDAGKDTDKTRLKGPGSKSHFCQVISSQELFYCGTVIQVDKLEAYCAASKGLCLPVVLSTKKGAEALELCPNPEKHGGLEAACHKRPSDLDISHVFKNLTRKATNAELKAANWQVAGKGKRKKA